MKNKNHTVLFLGLFIVMGVLLAISIVMLFNTSKVSFQQETSIRNIRGLDRLEVKASGNALPLSSFSSYDQAHGTQLYNMAVKLPSVSANQAVAPSDFEQLRTVAEAQFENQPQKVSCWWSVLRFLFVVVGVVIAPIWAKLLANFTDDWIYPLYKDAIKKRIDHRMK